MNPTRFQRAVLSQMQRWKNAGAVERSPKEKKFWVAFTLALFTLFVGYLIQLSFSDDDSTSILVSSIAFLVLICLVAGGVVVYLICFRAVQACWPVLSEVIDWKKLDSLLEQLQPPCR